jgi:Kef-type K+ transport system membrane component KefB
VIGVDEQSFLIIGLAAALAATIVAVAGSRFLVPVVVVEILLGILVGPDVLGVVESDEFIQFFSNLGLGMLFFFAGYEIDFRRVRGEPLWLAAIGWVASVAIAFSASGILALVGIAGAVLFTGVAIATTAIGTLIPVLGDAGETRTRFGTYLLAIGAIGEFLPILVITILFSSGHPMHEAALLIAFVAIAVTAALVAAGGVGRGWHIVERTIETSAQLAVRWAVVLIFALAALALSLGLDLLLGGFVAGIIAGFVLRDRDTAVFESKLSAVGYGLLIPFFFVTTGVNFDLDSLLSEPVRLLELPLFLALFLLVRGVPALLLYRRRFDRRDRAGLAFYSSTQLPLVVAITAIAVERGHMESGLAASLVGAAVLSTAIFPIVALRIRGDRPAREAEPSDAPDAPEPPPSLATT